jgi:phosphoribosyl 1,2-cyclic phosphate phosphodiesterase
VCASPNPKDKRTRASALIQTADATTILIDCGPDFRSQIQQLPFGKIDGVLITHEHYDHVGGLDDLRPFNRFGDVPIYAEATTIHHLHTRIPYCFQASPYPGIPHIRLEEIQANHPFHINQTQILPLRIMHGKLPILGYRIGKIAYITDMLTMPDDTLEQLKELDVLILNALRTDPHPAHQTIAQATKIAKQVAAKKTYFIHLSHQAGLHRELETSLPERIYLAFDGLTIPASEETRE